MNNRNFYVRQSVRLADSKLGRREWPWKPLEWALILGAVALAAKSGGLL